MAGAVGDEGSGKHKDGTRKKRRDDLYAVNSRSQGVVVAGAESLGFLVCLSSRVRLGAFI
jgi:hypothetical protein